MSFVLPACQVNFGRFHFSTQQQQQYLQQLPSLLASNPYLAPPAPALSLPGPSKSTSPSQSLTQSGAGAVTGPTTQTIVPATPIIRTERCFKNSNENLQSPS